MALVSIATVPISHLIIRNYIGENLSWDDAGYWQGMWYISTMYLLVVTTSLGVYFLPKLSEIQDKLELKKEILHQDIQSIFDMETELFPCLVEMKFLGVKVDVQKAHTMKQELASQEAK